MYLRKTARKNKDGSVVEYYQLAHNYRHPETKACAVEVIHNFGRADKLDRDALVRLCRSVARVAGLHVHDPLAEGEADAPVPANGGLPRGVRLLETKELGTVWAIEALWERLGIGPTLRRVAQQGRTRVPHERALLAMTANRLCEPESKLGVWDRWLRTVHLPSCQDLKLPQMYAAMDLLHGHAAEVEESVFFHTADLFNLEVDLVFYDTTTVSFSIDYEDQDTEESEGYRKLGNSKEGTWTPQVVVALAVTRQGLPVRSWVFPGNTTDVTTIECVRKDLRGWKLGRAMFVADSGMNSKENREELARACGKYLLATRLSAVTEVKEEVLSRRGRYKEIAENLKVKEVVVGDGERRRRYFLCLNAKEAKRQKRHRAQVLKELEEKLGRHPSKDPTQKWAVELLASKRYGRYLTIREGKGGKRVALDRVAAKAAARCDGKWVILSNDDTIGPEDAARGYRGLMVIERCFRSLKRTQIKMGPMYHWLRRRIEAHVKICVLALLIQRVAEIACKRPWAHIRRALRRLKATEFASESHLFFQRNELPESTEKTLQDLEVKAPASVLGVVKTG
jgi:transposase